jgi:uncharacterized protein YlxW (UPF0749 family)
MQELHMKEFFKNYGIIMILMLIVAWGIYDRGVQKGKIKEVLKTIKAMEKQSAEEIADKIKTIEKLQDDKLTLNKELTKVNQKINDLEAQRRLDREKIKELETKAQELPPESLVADMRDILETEEIWMMEDGILLSENAFRKIAFKVYDWQDFTLSREPRYMQELEQYKTNVYLLQQSIANLEQQNRERQGIIDTQKALNEDLKDFIKSKTKPGLWDTVKQVGTGIAIGTTVILILK